MSKCNEKFDAFDYVVELKTGDKVCFGSTMPRNTSPIGKGLAPHMRRYFPENFPKLYPGCYSNEKYSTALQTYKIRSKLGVPPLVDKAPRFKDTVHLRTPSPGRYDLSLKWGEEKQTKAAFGISSKVREMYVNNIPGPTTYNLNNIKKCRRTKVLQNFGKPVMLEAVENVCVIKPTDTCVLCEKICEGDYWHKNHEIFLCHKCWREECYFQMFYTKQQLKEFKKIRNCSFMHSHENTTAALRIMDGNKIKKKIRLENYLDLYITCD